MQGETRVNCSNLIFDIPPTESFLWSSSAPVGQPTCAASSCRRHWDPPPAATGGHPHCYFCLVLSKQELKWQQDKQIGTMVLLYLLCPSSPHYMLRPQAPPDFEPLGFFKSETKWSQLHSKDRC